MKNNGYIYIFICTVAIVIFGIISNSTGIATLASIFGMLASVLFAQNRRKAFIFNIVYCFLYTFILVQNQMYGLTINIFVFTLPMTIWGYIKWGKVEKNENSGIKYISKKSRIHLFLCVVIAIIVQSYILKICGGNNVILDSITSILCYVGWYLTSNKYFEQWIVWIIANFVNVVLWSILSFQDMQNITVLMMWVIYEINAIYGYMNFKRIFKI